MFGNEANQRQCHNRRGNDKILPLAQLQTDTNGDFRKTFEFHRIDDWVQLFMSHRWKTSLNVESPAVYQTAKFHHLFSCLYAIVFTQSVAKESR